MSSRNGRKHPKQAILTPMRADPLEEETTEASDAAATDEDNRDPDSEEDAK